MGSVDGKSECAGRKESQIIQNPSEVRITDGKIRDLVGVGAYTKEKITDEATI